MQRVASPLSVPKGVRNIDIFDGNAPIRQRWIRTVANDAAGKNVVVIPITGFIWFRVVAFHNSMTIAADYQPGWHVLEGNAGSTYPPYGTNASQADKVVHDQSFGFIVFAATAKTILLNGSDNSPQVYQDNANSIITGAPLGFHTSAGLFTKDVPLPQRKVFVGDNTLVFGCDALQVPTFLAVGTITNNYVRVCIQGQTQDQTN